MGQQSIRQEARRAALDAQSKRRRERAEREKRLEDLAVRVLVAVGERDAAVVDAERRAGQALREMTEDDGLSVREAVEWCGDEISTREAARLRRLVEDNRADGTGTPAQPRRAAGRPAGALRPGGHLDGFRDREIDSAGSRSSGIGSNHVDEI